MAMAQLAAGQYGVVSRAQLREAGLSDGAIERRVASGHLQRLHRGTYAVGHQALRIEGRWLAAVLAGGPGAVLSHRSAAAAWELLPPRAAAAARDPRARVDVTVTQKIGTKQASFNAHRSQLDAADVTKRHAIPITTISRTLLDYAEVAATRDDLDRALEAAHRQRRLHTPDLEAMLARAMGRHGLNPLKAALQRLDPLKAMTRSELERRAIKLLQHHALPRPAVNTPRGPYQLDLHWPARALIVELDGRAFHDTSAAFERDRRRDANHVVQGQRTLRFTWRQLTQDPSWVADCLTRVLS
jgi:very-short-patch-repair endonuclease